MILPRLSLIAAPFIALGSLAAPTTGYACGGYQCANDQFLPRAGTVPANIAAIAWSPGYDVRQGAGSTSPALPRFECTAADGSTHPVRFVALPEDKPDHLQLSEPLIAGEHCVISSGISDCSNDDPAYVGAAYLSGSAAFDVSADSAVPDDLGLIAVTGARLGAVDLEAEASCSENIEVCMVDASLDWSPAALPWKDALIFETFVDGARYSTSRNLSVPDELGGLYFGRDHDVVFSALSDVPANAHLGTRLERGEHSFAIRAHLPGSTQLLSTPAVTIVLSCGSDPEPPLAASMIDGDSGGCTVAPRIGGSALSSQPLFSIALGTLGMLLMATRRRKR